MKNKINLFTMDDLETYFFLKDSSNYKTKEKHQELWEECKINIIKYIKGEIKINHTMNTDNYDDDIVDYYKEQLKLMKIERIKNKIKNKK